MKYSLIFHKNYKEFILMNKILLQEDKHPLKAITLFMINFLILIIFKKK